MSRRRPQSSASSSAMSFFSFQDIVAATLGIMILTALLLALDPLSFEPVKPAAQPSEQGTASQDEIDALEEAVEKAQADVKDAAAQLASARAGSPLESEEVERVERLAEDLTKGAESAESAESEITEQAAAESQRVARARDALEVAEKATLSLEVEIARAARRARVQYRPGDKKDLEPLLVELAAGKVSCGVISSDGVPTALADVAPGADVHDVITRASVQHPPARCYLLFVLHPGQEAVFEVAMNEWYARGYDVGWQLWDSAAGGLFDDPLADGAAAPEGATP